MAVSVDLLEWTRSNRPVDLISRVNEKKSDYVAAGIRSTPQSVDLISRSADTPFPADVIVVFDPVSRFRWQRLRELLPSSLYAMAAIADDDCAIGFSTKAIESQTNIFKESTSLGELVVRLAEQGSVVFAATDHRSHDNPILVPELTTPSGGPRFPFLRGFIQHIQIPEAQTSSTRLHALKAGFFLLNDFFDESHSCSQSIEGLGQHHTGDYWHAILHRREPDYGNSKYWFRHVGRHPAFADVATAAGRQLDTAEGSLSEKLLPWKERLVSNGRWDPFAFVDLCAASESDSELREWCECVQHEEMLLLLEFTYCEATTI